MEVFIFYLPFLLVALLYASVGHGGASGYLAIMALLAVDPTLLRATALGLNVIVSLIGTIAFFRAGHFNAKLFWPLALSAIPFAYLGGGIALHEGIFRKILGITLLIALIRLFMPDSKEGDSRSPKLWIMIISGAFMGFISGLIGVGGGIFLTPLVILLGWAPTKTAAAISAPFILLNSLAGLAGLNPQLSHFLPHFTWIAVAVFFAGIIGSLWGSRFAEIQQVRWALALVLGLAAFKLFL